MTLSFIYGAFQEMERALVFLCLMDQNFTTLILRVWRTVTSSCDFPTWRTSLAIARSKDEYRKQVPDLRDCWATSISINRKQHQTIPLDIFIHSSILLNITKHKSQNKQQRQRRTKLKKMATTVSPTLTTTITTTTTATATNQPQPTIPHPRGELALSIVFIILLIIFVLLATCLGYSIFTRHRARRRGEDPGPMFGSCCWWRKTGDVGPPQGHGLQPVVSSAGIGGDERGREFYNNVAADGRTEQDLKGFTMARYAWYLD